MHTMTEVRDENTQDTQELTKWAQKIIEKGWQPAWKKEKKNHNNIFTNKQYKY